MANGSWVVEGSGLWREPEVGKGAGMAIADAPAELIRQRTTVMASLGFGDDTHFGVG